MSSFYLKPELYVPRTLASSGRVHFMMIYQEKIAPPLPIPLTDDEKMKLTEAAASEDRWVKDFVDRLAGVVRDLKN
jgi:hypothetical protein